VLNLALFRFDVWVVVIEMVGSLIIVGYCAAALATLIRSRGRGICAARLLIADGVITGLGFKLAGTLLKTVLLVSWHQILMFAAILALRTVLKRLFAWEQQHLKADDPTASGIPAR
jgi:uncharacterized membrane protein